MSGMPGPMKKPNGNTPTRKALEAQEKKNKKMELV